MHVKSAPQVLIHTQVSATWCNVWTYGVRKEPIFHILGKGPCENGDDSLAIYIYWPLQREKACKPALSKQLLVRVCMRVCVYVRACICVCIKGCVSVRACVRVQSGNILWNTTAGLANNVKCLSSLAAFYHGPFWNFCFPRVMGFVLNLRVSNDFGK